MSGETRKYRVNAEGAIAHEYKGVLEGDIGIFDSVDKDGDIWLKPSPDARWDRTRSRLCFRPEWVDPVVESPPVIPDEITLNGVTYIKKPTKPVGSPVAAAMRDGKSVTVRYGDAEQDFSVAEIEWMSHINVELRAELYSASAPRKIGGTQL